MGEEERPERATEGFWPETANSQVVLRSMCVLHSPLLNEPLSKTIDLSIAGSQECKQ